MLAAGLVVCAVPAGLVTAATGDRSPQPLTCGKLLQPDCGLLHAACTSQLRSWQYGRAGCHAARCCKAHHAHTFACCRLVEAAGRLRPAQPSAWTGLGRQPSSSWPGARTACPCGAPTPPWSSAPAMSRSATLPVSIARSRLPWLYHVNSQRLEVSDVPVRCHKVIECQASTRCAVQAARRVYESALGSLAPSSQSGLKQPAVAALALAAAEMEARQAKAEAPARALHMLAWLLVKLLCAFRGTVPALPVYWQHPCACTVSCSGCCRRNVNPAGRGGDNQASWSGLEPAHVHIHADLLQPHREHAVQGCTSAPGLPGSPVQPGSLWWAGRALGRCGHCCCPV